jgi:hypothetical protein
MLRRLRINDMNMEFDLHPMTIPIRIQAIGFRLTTIVDFSDRRQRLNEVLPRFSAQTGCG